MFGRGDASAAQTAANRAAARQKTLAMAMGMAVQESGLAVHPVNALAEIRSPCPRGRIQLASWQCNHDCPRRAVARSLDGKETPCAESPAVNRRSFVLIT